MSPLVFKCPVTNLHMISGIFLADDVREAMSRNSLHIQCPLCAGVHPVAVRPRGENDGGKPARAKGLPGS
jgi:hypothetical protein